MARDARLLRSSTKASNRIALGGWRTVTTGVALAIGALMLVTLIASAGSPDFALDFREAYLPAARSVVEAGSPYAVNEASVDGISGMYLYPPQLAIALTPATPLPVDLAAFLAFLGSLCALVAALALLGVRDIRCYAILPAWAPAWQSLQMVNISALLVLGVALVWRYRDDRWRGGLPLGLAVSLKLFLWPVLAWALATGRSRRALSGAVVGLAVTAVSWAAIGFDGLAGYPELLRTVAEQPSYSTGAVVENLGFGPVVAYVLTLGAGTALLGLSMLQARRGDEFRAFTASIAAALALTPILWWHYLTFLVVPLSIARPRFSFVWLVPIAVWLSRIEAGAELATAVPVFVAAVLVATILMRPSQARVEGAQRATPTAATRS